MQAAPVTKIYTKILTQVNDKTGFLNLTGVQLQSLMPCFKR